MQSLKNYGYSKELSTSMWIIYLLSSTASRISRKFSSGGRFLITNSDVLKAEKNTIDYRSFSGSVIILL
tara:strand:+ start:18053 stop:18259 length:207 start_codon:yes stop_codon:yes gene_type:complete